MNTRNDLIGRMTPLLIAADAAEYPIVLALLQANADVDAADNFKNTPLHRACMEPVKKGKIIVFTKHFKLDKIYFFIFYQGTLLEVAVRETVKCLCSHGANPLLKNSKGNTPMDELQIHIRDHKLSRHLAVHHLQSYLQFF